MWNAVWISGSWRLLDCCFGAGRTVAKSFEYVVDDIESMTSAASETTKAEEEEAAAAVNEFVKELNEHYFLTDPDEFIYTHFPYSRTEAHYSRWQLLSRPITLKAFNAMPYLNPMFFEYSLRLGQDLPSPIVIAASITDEAEVPLEISLWAWEVVRYKYKLYPADEHWSKDCNQHGFCYLKVSSLITLQLIAYSTYH